MSETDAALIEQVVRDVISRLGAGERGSKSALAVVLSVGDADAQIRVIREIGERGHSVECVGVAARAPASTRASLAGVSPVVVCGTAGAAPLPSGLRAVVAPALSLGDAAKLALGVLDDIAPEWLWAALARGAPVLATPGDGFDVPKGSGLARVTEARRAGCERLGVQWCDADALPIMLSARVATEAEPGAVHVPVGGRRTLVTEAMVANLAEGTPEIVVPMGAAVTPLARDLARRRGIRVRLRT